MSDASMIGIHVFTVCEDKTRIDDDNVVISVYDGKLGTQFGPGLQSTPNYHIISPQISTEYLVAATEYSVTQRILFG